MNAPAPLPSSTKAREYRDAFDATFAAPPPPPAPPVVALLLVRVDGSLFAVRRSEMTGFVRGDAIAPAPGRASAFLGLAEMRGEIYPVWSLAGLLGRPLPPPGSSCWLVLVQNSAGAPCALACAAVDKLIFVPESDLTAPARPGAPALAPWGAESVPVVDVPALLADIFKRKQ
ncbi:MAG: chemotaxis protein CheW [Verrucomicrobia bacterium]|nr:chemotaxis protein CheW [Verrucomicrobiota bacterium]